MGCGPDVCGCPPHSTQHRRRCGSATQRAGVWAGGGSARWRSFPLAALAPPAAAEGVRLASLQRGHGSEQLAALRGRFEVLDLGEGLDEDGAFLDTAAMTCLDLVASADTSAVHVAGA